jgi:hypothetical protein
MMTSTIRNGRFMLKPGYAFCVAFLVFASAVGFAAEPPDYASRIQPLLTKYCAGCHNDDDREGKLSVSSYAAMLKGGAKGAVINPGHADLSRLTRVLTGKAEPAMPPKDNERPKDDEIKLLIAWIDAGAKGPTGAAADPTLLVTPQIPLKAPQRQFISAAAVNPAGNVIALARFGEIELQSLPEQKTLHKLTGLRGSVNGVAFSEDGSLVVAAAGEPGLQGEARIWRVADGDPVQTIRGHKDSLYTARFSPNGETLATGSYDHQIKLWDVKSGKEQKTLDGHNGPVFELAFRPDGKVLASASGDRTVKLWDIASGQRLETLKESLKELYALAFHPDGSKLAAAGVDNRIRIWQVSPSAKEGTNPLLLSQYAHELAVLRLAWSKDGKTMVSTGEERLIKVWNAEGMTIRSTLEKQTDWALGLSLTPSAERVIAGRLDGSVAIYSIPAPAAEGSLSLIPAPEVPPVVDYGPQPSLAELAKTAEVEPNDLPTQATRISSPGIGTGKIFAPAGQASDHDLFVFTAKAGDQWIVETNASRAGSPLDTKIEILDRQGKSIPKLLLRAVRDTELEFRGANSDQRGFRVKNWDEMYLNEYVYFSGDVIKLYQQRRGPDADGQFFPENGNRLAMFETTARAHPLGEPGFMVVPYPVGTKLPDNGLPVIPLFFENDDDGYRRLGKDSRVTFVAPADGDYLVKVADVRGSQGEKFTYDLIIRRPQPSFKVTLGGGNAAVNAGSGKAFSVKAERIDNFMGPIRVELRGLPVGYQAMSPLVIEEGLYEAKGVLNAAIGATQMSEDDWKKVDVVATADVAGKMISQTANNLGKPTVQSRPKLVAHLELTDAAERPLTPSVERKWEPLAVQSATALSATLTKQDDQSILASGENADTEVYTVQLKTEARNIRALKLDVLGDKSLPAGAPGRATPNGNFVLTGIKITAAPANDAEKKQPVVISAAKADYSQPNWESAGLIDSDDKTGWAIALNDAAKGYPVKKKGESADHQVELELKESLAGFDGGTLLTVTLEQKSIVKQHNLGRFKISAAADAGPPLPVTFAKVPELSITAGGSVTCRLRIERFDFGGRVQFEVENLPHGIIVDDIGLNGILINEKETERTVFLRAEPWVKPQSRLIFAEAKVEGNQCTLPLLIHVK